MKSFLFAFAAIFIVASIVQSKELDDASIIYQVSLRHRVRPIHFCSGVILSKDWILTTARCVHNFPSESIIAVYGSRLLDGPHKVAYIERIFGHQEFNSMNLENDIAMLLTKTEIQLQLNLIGAIQLPTHIGCDAFSISGWGIRNVCIFTIQC